MTDNHISSTALAQLAKTIELTLKRLDVIARYCHEQRKIVRDSAFPKITSRWLDPVLGSPVDFDTYGDSVEVKYSWWDYDCQPELMITFPASYLDLPDLQWMAIEKKAADEAVVRKAEHDRVIEAGAEAARKEAFEKKREKVMATMADTVPDWAQLPTLTQNSIIATAMGARP
jgi:hypothetical protein